jgi:hypothetical protein
MSASDIINQRLHNQRLSHSEVKNPVKLVEWLVAVQGQDYAGAKWALGMRLPGSTDAEIEKAIADGKILRTWALRGTLHFVAPADIHWLLDLLAVRMIEKNTRRYRQLELDEKTLKQSNAALEKALSDGQARTRKQLMLMLEEKGISTKGQRAPYMLQRASLDGLIAQGVAPRNDPLYRLLDQPKAKKLKKDEALAELALRYFTSRGPTTLADFVWWSGLVTPDARAGLEAVKDKLVEDTIDRQTYWLAESGLKRQSHSTNAYLLPAYDEYIFAYKNRDAILDELDVKQVKRANGFSPVLIINGRVAGVWKRTLKKASVVVDVTPFHKLKSAEKDSLETAARRYADFLKLDLVVS